MSRKTKIWLITAGALVLAGSLLFAGTMAAQSWDFTRLSTVKYETNTYEIDESFGGTASAGESKADTAGNDKPSSSDSPASDITNQFETNTHEIGGLFHDIAVTTDIADVSFALSEDGTCRVECYEAENARHLVSVEQDTLVIQIDDQSSWYAQIGIYFGTPKITVYLPESQYRTLTITGSTGAIEVPEAFTFESAEISSSTGSVAFRAAVSGTASIQTTTGDIRAEHTSAGALNLTVTTGAVNVSDMTCQNDLTISVSTGKAALRNVSCKNLTSSGSVGSITLDHVTAAEQFSIERSTGHVNFTACDAGEIHVKTDTGDVTGSLLSEKIFFAESDVGSVDVPKTTTGGICDLQTDTGNIAITIE